MVATWPEAMSRLTRAIGAADNSRTALTNAGGYVPTEALILGDGFSFSNTGVAPNEAAYKNGMLAMRAGLAAAVQNCRAETDAALAELALSLGYSGLSGSSALPWIYQSMATNKNSAGAAFSTANLTVPTRNITRGASSTTGTGNGVLTRLAIDRYGFPLEADTPEPILMTCRRDVTLGANPGQEAFDCFAGGAPAGDVFQIWTTGFGDGLQAPSGAAIGVTADTSASLGVQNPSFAQSSGTGASSSFVLSGWTLSSGSAASMSVSTASADIYRASAIEGATPGALKVTGSVTLTQTLASNNGSLDATRAYFSRLAVNRSNYTGGGTITVQVGSRSWSVVLAAQSGYVALSPPLSSPTDATNGPNLWFPNFDANGFAVTITITVTSGALLIDDFTWGPFTSVANKLLWVGGGSTNFLYGDTLTFTDSEPLGGSLVGITNHWLSRLYGVWTFPSSSQPATPGSAPTAAVSGTAGAVTAGAHYYAVSYYNNATGVEGPVGPVSTILVSDGTKKVDLSAIPTSGALYRKIYMTQAGGNPLSLLFVASINDNSTTTYALNTADAALTLVAPAAADV